MKLYFTLITRILLPILLLMEGGLMALASPAFSASADLSAPGGGELRAVHYLYDAQSGERFLGVGDRGADAQAVDEGVAFNVLATQAPGTAGLYRCVSVRTHHYFLSKEVGCGGEITESLLGYIAPGELQTN